MPAIPKLRYELEYSFWDGLKAFSYKLSSTPLILFNYLAKKKFLIFFFGYV